MLRKTHKTLLAVSFALVAILASAIPVAAQSSYYNLRMENNTGYDIYELYFSSIYSGWGDDLLGPGRIFPDGSTFTITDISPGHYDIAFVDEDEDVCVVRNVAIYQNLDWNLSQVWLLNCEWRSVN